MVFALTSDTDPTLFAPEDLLSGQTYELYARMMFLELFEQDQALVPLLNVGYTPNFALVHLEHYDLDGFFDHAHATLRLETLGDTPFLYTVRFSRNRRLVTTAVLTGRLQGGVHEPRRTGTSGR